ncbi:MAG: 4-hydroxy-3-methylbut-2-enyl diphosphate reductase, partial [Desulfovibrio sp.]|nr:4-hydroxy-3-methylbut-2-enyl diphosphate reductase [Desulfovibrio sp.]
ALASEAGVATYHVETADELKAEDFRGVATVGLTAGASTPKALNDAAEARLRNMA